MERKPTCYFYEIVIFSIKHTNIVGHKKAFPGLSKHVYDQFYFDCPDQFEALMGSFDTWADSP